jgi:hypothetical protein
MKTADCHVVPACFLLTPFFNCQRATLLLHLVVAKLLITWLTRHPRALDFKRSSGTRFLIW